MKQVRLHESLRALFYTPYYAALERGGHETEGLDVILSQPSGPNRAASDLFDGYADVTWGGPMRMLQHMNQDPDPDRRLIAFAEAVARDPFVLVGNKPRLGFRFDDLRECRLATVSEVPTPWMCLQEDLRRAGIDPGEIDRVTDKSMSENVDALREGKVDVIQVFEPFVQSLISEGVGHVWYAAALRGLTSYTTYYAPISYCRQERDTLLGLTRALYDTQTWLHAASSSEIATTVHKYFPELSAPVLEGSISRYLKLGVWGRDPRLAKTGFLRLKMALISGDFIKRDTPYEECVDPSIAEGVMAER
ncbi:MAG: ABC transporter substrate-binding protein [Rhodospirillales bacterium]